MTKIILKGLPDSGRLFLFALCSESTKNILRYHKTLFDLLFDFPHFPSYNLKLIPPDIVPEIYKEGHI